MKYVAYIEAVCGTWLLGISQKSQSQSRISDVPNDEACWWPLYRNPIRDSALHKGGGREEGKVNKTRRIYCAHQFFAF
jgi:hypothetical protein